MANALSNNSLQIIHQLIHKTLAQQHKAGTIFGQQLVEISSQWLELDAEQTNINLLPELTCKAVGGDISRAVPVVAAWQLVRLAAKFLDDVEDNELTNQIAVTINTAVGFLNLAQILLWELLQQDISAAKVQRLSQSLNQTILQACSGQHLDLISKSDMANMDPEIWLGAAAAKSGTLLAWAAWAGALVAGGHEDRLAYCYTYGYHLGILLQTADDFNGVWVPNNSSDLKNNSFTLPVCYALSVTKGKERKYLERLLKKALSGNSAAEAEIKQIMIEIGTQAYLLVVGKLHYQQSLKALHKATNEQQSVLLLSLLNNVWPAISG